MVEPTYRITSKSSILCRLCGMESHHPDDVSHLYCGNCGVFHEVVMLEIEVGGLDAFRRRFDATPPRLGIRPERADYFRVAV